VCFDREEPEQRGEWQRAGVSRIQAGEEQVPPAVHPAGGREAGVLLQLHTLAGQDTSTRSSTLLPHYIEISVINIIKYF
jgi:hypothetical protein